MKPEQDAFSKFEHEGWQRVATKYEQAWSGLTRGFIPLLLDASEIAAPVQLLDVACGPGYVAEAALARGAQPTGLDFSAEMVRLAKQRCPQIDFREGDAQALPFPDNSFDRVVMNFGLLHLANPPAAFSESFRVLRPGGRYAFTVWAGPDLSPGAKLVDNAVKAHANMNVSLPQGPDCFAYGNRDDSANALAAVGFPADSVSFQTVTVEWQVPGPSFVFESERSAGVRTAALLAKQTPEALDAIQAHIEDAVRSYAKGGGFSLPYAAHVVAVQKR